MNLLRRFAIYWLPIVIWMAVILGLSSQSTLPARNDPVTGERVPSTYPLAKTWHAIEYSVLSLLIFRAVISRGGGLGLRPLSAVVATFMVCLAFGALDETRQSFVPRREASPFDVLIDSSAALVAAIVAAAWVQRRARSRISAPTSQVSERS